MYRGRRPDIGYNSSCRQVEVICVLPEMARGHATSGTWVCVTVLALLGLFEALCMWLLKKVSTHASLRKHTRLRLIRMSL